MKNNNKFLTYEPGVPCHTVITHFDFHPEEIAGIVALQYYGDNIHPGITDAIENKRIIFLDAGITSYKGMDWQELHQKGYVSVGTLAGPYDEHYLPDQIREKECSASLIARALQLNTPEFRKIFDQLVWADRNSENDFLSFSSHLRRAHLVNPVGDQACQMKVLDWCMKPFEDLFQLQNRFANETSIECKKNARIVEIEYFGEIIRIAMIQSDDRQITSLAKTSLGVKANVIICKNSKGHVYICTSNPFTKPDEDPFIIDLSPVSKSIQIEEMGNGGLKYDPNDPRFEEEGSVSHKWHFQKEAQRLFSGSSSAPNKPLSRIPLGRIMGIVVTTLKEAGIQQAMVRRMVS